MVNLPSNLERLKPFKVLVVGDFMLDRYTTGYVERISPEAPVPVLHASEEHSLPGGAGNVALNLAALGAQVSVLGRIGPDSNGKLLKHLLEEESIDTSALLSIEGYCTPVKNRLIASGQQMLRIDHEELSPFEDHRRVLPHLGGVDLIAISDYNKGFLSRPLLKAVIAHANQHNIPVLVDPKGQDFTKYQGATLIKPNLKEAYAAAKMERKASLEDVAETLLADSQAEHIMITRSGDGLSLFTKGKTHQHFPVRVHELKDVTGAGDTVLAMLAMCFANGIEPALAARLANVAASLAIEHLGCSRLDLGQISERLLTFDTQSKVFDESHIFALEQALKHQSFSLLGIDPRLGMTTELFRAIQSLSETKLILYLRDARPDSTFIELLASLHEVDFIVIKSDSLAALTERLQPSKTFVFEEDELRPLAKAQALLS